jgi:type II secretion system protein J
MISSPFPSPAPVPPRLDKAGTSRDSEAFTLVEILIAISILALVVTAIYSSWTAILRSSKAGLQAAATVQRSRIVVRVLEDSLGSALSFAANQPYYSFVAENGNDASLSFVARLAKSFPRSGKFGDLDVRRLTFSLESGTSGSRELVLRQCPIVMDLDVDEKNHPVVLARNVREFQLQFWDARLNDWVDEWKQTNQLPRGIMVTLKLADTAQSSFAQEEITRIINLPATAVQRNWQMPQGGPATPGAPGLPGAPGTPAPGAPGTPLPGTPVRPAYPANPGNPGFQPTGP